MPPKEDGKNQQNQKGNLQDNLLNEAAKLISSTHVDNKLQAHGKTVGEMKELQQHQIAGTEETMPANCVKTVLIKKAEKHMIHVTLEQVRFDENTGQRLSKPQLKKFYVDDFEKMSKTSLTKEEKKNKKFAYAENAFGAYKVIMIHDPRKEKDYKGPKPLVQAPVVEEPEQKLEDLTTDQLREKYTEVTGEEADPEDTDEMLIALINEKLAETK